MTVETVMHFMEDYGSFFVFALIFIEYLCIPGFPGGICIPASGVICRLGRLNFFKTYLLGIVSALLAQVMVYGICLFFRIPVQDFCLRHKTLAKAYARANDFIEKRGELGLLIARMVPFARAYVSFPAGFIGMKFGPYVWNSAFGTSVYILVVMSMGYFSAELFV